jgi:hypothetical protein
MGQGAGRTGSRDGGTYLWAPCALSLGETVNEQSFLAGINALEIFGRAPIVVARFAQPLLLLFGDVDRTVFGFANQPNYTTGLDGCELLIDLALSALEIFDDVHGSPRWAIYGFMWWV